MAALPSLELPSLAAPVMPFRRHSCMRLVSTHCLLIHLRFWSSPKISLEDSSDSVEPLGRLPSQQAISCALDSYDITGDCYEPTDGTTRYLGAHWLRPHDHKEHHEYGVR